LAAGFHPDTLGSLKITALSRPLAGFKGYGPRKGKVMGSRGGRERGEREQGGECCPSRN